MPPTPRHFDSQRRTTYTRHRTPAGTASADTNTGLLGYDAGGQPDRSWRGRDDGRNAAFTDLLFSSGLRLREGGCLLTPEVPDAVGGHGYREGTVAGAVAKRRQRMFYASAAALRRVAAYVATTRVDAVRRARRHQRFEQVQGKLVVTRVSHGATGPVGCASSPGHDRSPS